MEAPKHDLTPHPIPVAQVPQARVRELAHAVVTESLKASVLDPPDLTPAEDGPRIKAATPFTEAAPMRLQVDTQKVLRAATLALGMAIPAAAGTPKAYPSQEARLLAKLQIHDRTMEASRQQVNERDARNGRTAEVKPAETPTRLEDERARALMLAGLIGAGTLAAAYGLTPEKRREQKEGATHVHA